MKELMEYKNRNKSLVEISLITAIIFILMMISTFSIFNFIGEILIPIVITVIYLRDGKKAVGASLIISGILTTIFINPFIGLIRILLYGMVGIVLGVCISKDRKATLIIFYLWIINIVGIIIDTIIELKVFTNVSLTSSIQNFVDDFHKSINMMIDSGIITSVNNQVLNSISVDKILMVIPLIIILKGLIIGFLNFIMAKGILKRLGYKINSLSSFSNWYVDSRIAALLILGNCIVIFLKIKQIEYSNNLYYITSNILMITFMIQGLSLVSYFLKNKAKLSNKSITLLSFIIIISPLMIFLLPLGIADLIFDFRGVDSNSLGTFLREKNKTLKKG